MAAQRTIRLAVLGLLVAAPVALAEQRNATPAASVQSETADPGAQAEREDKIEIYGTSHEVDSPRDATTANASGRRTYEPIIIRKRIDGERPKITKPLTH